MNMQFENSHAPQIVLFGETEIGRLTALLCPINGMAAERAVIWPLPDGLTNAGLDGNAMTPVHLHGFWGMLAKLVLDRTVAADQPPSSDPDEILVEHHAERRG